MASSNRMIVIWELIRAANRTHPGARMREYSLFIRGKYRSIFYSIASSSRLIGHVETFLLDRSANRLPSFCCGSERQGSLIRDAPRPLPAADPALGQLANQVRPGTGHRNRKLTCNNQKHANSIVLPRVRLVIESLVCFHHCRRRHCHDHHHHGASFLTTKVSLPNQP